jgi:IPT/TIG domain-containing protein
VSRYLSRIVVSFVVILQLACGGGTAPSKPNPPVAPSANISISPGDATAGSPDLILTVLGSKDFTFSNAAHQFSQVVWSQGEIDTRLVTTFVSSSELTAVVPTALLASALAAKVRVEIWDTQGDAPMATSSVVTFQVTSTSTLTPSISSIEPSSVVAGSADVTITIKGANFGRYGHISSTVFWTTNGNLHDTGTWLDTTILSDTQITAVIPAKLLGSPTSVQIVVLNGDIMGMSDGFFGYPKSNAVTFQVTP